MSDFLTGNENEKKEKVVTQCILVAIYDRLPRKMETQYTENGRTIFMANCQEMTLDNNAEYPYKYQDANDIGWTKSVARHVAEWFWKQVNIKDEDNFFVAKVKVENDRIFIMWGLR